MHDVKQELLSRRGAKRKNRGRSEKTFKEEVARTRNCRIVYRKRDGAKSSLILRNGGGTFKRTTFGGLGLLVGGLELEVFSSESLSTHSIRRKKKRH